MVKALKEVGIEGTYFKIIKAIHDELITKIILNDEESLKILPLISGWRQGCSLSLFLFNMGLSLR
jgi:hypothetical protein